VCVGSRISSVSVCITCMVCTAGGAHAAQSPPPPTHTHSCQLLCQGTRMCACVCQRGVGLGSMAPAAVVLAVTEQERQDLQLLAHTPPNPTHHCTHAHPPHFPPPHLPPKTPFSPALLHSQFTCTTHAPPQQQRGRAGAQGPAQCPQPDPASPQSVVWWCGGLVGGWVGWVI
jgi:hypothetical protein